MARQSQRKRILQLLQERAGRWVPLWEILELGAAQYGARIREIRRSGHIIENRMEVTNGSTHSWYQLVMPKGQQSLFREPAE